jgi:hypothetical protein
MKFNNKTLSEGKAGYRVNNATEKLTKDGADMMVLDLLAKDENGVTAPIKHFLPDFQIEEFLNSIGRPDLFKKGEFFASEIMDSTGVCNIKQDVYQGISRMKVGNFLMPITPRPKSENPKTTEIPHDEDVPF